MIRPRALAIVGYAATLAACALFVPIDDHDLAPPVLAPPGDDAGQTSQQDSATTTDAANIADAPTLAADAVLIDQQAAPRDIFTSGQQVYWVSYGDRTLRSSPKGSPQAQLLRTTTGQPSALIQLDSLNMAWCEDGRVVFGTLDGKAAGTRVDLGYACLRLSVAPNQIYATAGNGSIWEFGLSTGQATLSVDVGATAVAYGGSSIFWSNPTKNRIMKFDRPSGPAVEFSRDQIGPVDLALDDANAYWLTDVGVMKLDRTTPLGVPIALASGQKAPTRMALDATNVYWTNGGANTVMMVPKAGGTPSTIGSCVGNPYGIAVDVDGVYFTCPTDGTVKVAKKQ